MVRNALKDEQYALEDEHKKYLGYIAWDECIGTRIENRIKRNLKGHTLGKLALYLVFFALLVGVILIFQVYLSFFNIYEFLLIICIPYVYLYIALWVFERSRCEYDLFTHLIACIDKMDDALIGSPTMSEERRELAKRLLGCSRKMRSYRSLVPYRLDQRIRNDKVLQACFALRQLARLVMLGNADELRQLKDDIARAAIRVGTAYWEHVGHLAGVIPEPARTRARIASLVPVIGLFIPLITAIITAVVKLSP